MYFPSSHASEWLGAWGQFLIKLGKLSPTSSADTPRVLWADPAVWRQVSWRQDCWTGRHLAPSALSPSKTASPAPFRKALVRCSVQRMAWGRRHQWLFFSLARESTVPGPGACQRSISSPLSGPSYLKSSLSAFFSKQFLLVPSSNSNPFLLLLFRAMILNLGSIIRTPWEALLQLW